MIRTVVGFLALAASALAGFNPQSGRNVAVYWGQNSASVGQEQLAYFCNSVDIVNLAFITSITPAAVDFASATSKCIKSPLNTGVLLCRELQEDIKTCQAKGTTVLISMGGGNSPSPNRVDAADAEKSAQLIWDMFGPVTSSKVDRPFGTSVVNGFDLDFETPVNHLSPFADRLRHLMDSATDKFYLSAAPLP